MTIESTLCDHSQATTLHPNTAPPSPIRNLVEIASSAGSTSTPSCIDVWVLSRQRFAPDRELLFALLDGREKVRAKSFRAERHQQGFVIARAVLRILIAAYCACDPNQVAFDYGPQGKPALTMPPRLSRDLGFNLSHSGDAVLIALTRDAEIGADVEEISSGSIRSEAIADSCLNAAELHRLEHVPACEKSLLLLRLWTHKEAYLKAIGCGLSMPPQDLTVTFTDCEHSMIHRPPPSRQPLFGFDLPYGGDYVGAVVGTNQFQKLRFFRL